MTYYGSFGNNNLYLAGNQNYGTVPQNDYGIYGAMYRRCTCYCNCCNPAGCSGCSNYSMLYAMGCTFLTPWYDTSTKCNCYNFAFNTTVRNQDRNFTLNVARANSTQIATIRYAQPRAIGYTNTDFLAGFSNTGLSNVNNQVTIDCQAAYQYAFANWRTGSSSGTIISTSQAPTFTFNSSYGGISFLSIQTAVATANFTSDRILKRNIKLVGKSTRGINIYTWNYKNPEKFGYGTYQGVMAQEVPYATVEHPDGYLMVDYSKTDVTFKKLYGNNMGFRKRS